ncbi:MULTISPECIES: hypothetical protein [Methylobacteriaceae]|jgi:hypothetical protein|uniref:Uncharacterized protein n=3 Tax=Methylobacterium TaxID=407 RepID=A0A512J150_9HYPH|nr:MULTISPECIES: hypothetical protein [Methylobacterium]MBY0295000.1 hypothetical protein [Methylobacterium sp.]MDN3621682.1 hypothetical protein [Methylobacterium isbiliense]GEP03710.1 hypothetical protein MOX02_17480 [Methylobacterium oxalidis]GJE00673.1 hypothetical protein GMJLKIPL_2597 [Methylobacterium isbiliense]GJE33684.1 hypothetical protein LDDCCGHA_3885 [Methylobacterium oxalidis]
MALPLHPDALEFAARLLLGEEFKRPLARLLGPHHPDGSRATLDPRLPFRWLAPERLPNGDRNPAWRPIPPWVAPVLGRLLAERAEELEGQAGMARRHSAVLLNWNEGE